MPIFVRIILTLAATVAAGSVLVGCGPAPGTQRNPVVDRIEMNPNTGFVWIWSRPEGVNPDLSAYIYRAGHTDEDDLYWEAQPGFYRNTARVIKLKRDYWEWVPDDSPDGGHYIWYNFANDRVVLVIGMEASTTKTVVYSNHPEAGQETITMVSISP